jgi:uncharacterized protein involved in exopolysaccharide biosynthesis
MEKSRLFIRRSEMPTAPEIEAEARPIFLDETEPLIDVSRYWRTVRKHLRLAIAVTVGCLALTAIHTMTETPIYTAETTIMIEPAATEGSSTLENLVELETAVANSDQYYKTQCQVLQSRNLAAHVIRDLGLQHNPNFAEPRHKPGLLSQIWSGSGSRIKRVFSYREKVAPAAAASTDESFQTLLPDVHEYLAMPKVSPIPDTNLVKIAFATPNAQLSEQLANAHVEAYERQKMEMRGQQSEEAERFLQNKLVDIKEQLEKSEAALNDYRRRKGIIPGLISLDGKDAVVLDRLADLSKDLTTAQVERIGLQAQVQIIRKHDYASLPAVLQNGGIQQLNQQLNELYAENAALSSQFRRTYPPLAKLQARIRAVRAQLTNEIGRVVAGIESTYQEAAGKENRLQREMDRQRTETLNLNDAAAQYAMLQRDVDTNHQLYNAVMTRMKDVSVTNGAQNSSVAVVNSAEVPQTPTSPNKGREMMLALVVGLSAGAGLAFLLEFLDNTLKNPEEAENYLRVPSLGIVPEFSSLSGRGSPYGSRELLNDRPAAALPPGRELVACNVKNDTIIC